MLPLLEAHDHRHFEIFCYASSTPRTGSPAAAAPWPTCGEMSSALSDEQLADAIRQDRIDILVDLTMHMADNRLLVFARKPAPVQVTLSGLLRHDGAGGTSTIA